MQLGYKYKCKEVSLINKKCFLNSIHIYLIYHSHDVAEKGIIRSYPLGERPGVNAVVSDDFPSRTAICVRSERNTANQFRVSFLMPYYCNHSISIRFSNP